MMKKVKFNLSILIAAVLVIGGIAIWAWQSGYLSGSAESKPMDVFGVVTNLNNQPETNVNVTLKSDPADVPSYFKGTQTTVTGKYFFFPVPHSSRPYTILALKEDPFLCYNLKRERQVYLIKDHNQVNLQLKKENKTAAQAKGKITDNEGRAISNAEILIRAKFPDPYVHLAYSDSGGQYQTQCVLEIKNYFFQVKASGYRDLEKKYSLHRGENIIDFSLEKAPMMP